MPEVDGYSSKVYYNTNVCFVTGQYSYNTVTAVTLHLSGFSLVNILVVLQRNMITIFYFMILDAILRFGNMKIKIK